MIGKFSVNATVGNSSDHNQFAEYNSHAVLSTATAADDNVTTMSYAVDDDVSLTSLRHQLQTTRFVVNKVLAPTVVAFGLLGNALAIIILTRRSMKSSTSSYLTALAVYDSVYLLLALSMTLTHYPAVRQAVWYTYYQKPIGRPLTDIASNTAVILTVTFTIERFISVRFPLKGKVRSYFANTRTSFKKACSVLSHPLALFRAFDLPFG